MRKHSYFIFIGIYTFLFTLLIVLGRQMLFPNTDHEERYVEPLAGEESFLSPQDDPNEFESFSGVTQEEVKTRIHDLIYENFKEKYSLGQKRKVSFRYIPSSFLDHIEFSYLPIAEVFLYKKDILNRIEKLGLYLYQKEGKTRGRMKSGNIHMYGVSQMLDEEFLSVLIHEYSHHYDIYSLPASRFGDTSQKFYDISWSSVTIPLTGQTSGDFVSGYAMTNWYEDFAESYTYYVLHNKDFVEKASNNASLKRKYDFFQNYVFTQNQFYKENFSTQEQKKPYYWDITKLGVDVKKFLQYLQDDI